MGEESDGCIVGRQAGSLYHLKLTPRFYGQFGGGFGRVGENGEVPHLAAGTGFAFAVEVKFEAGGLEGRRPVGVPVLPDFAEEVGHGGGFNLFGGTEGEAADGADLLFELTSTVGVDGEMAGIVGAGGKFVDEEPAIFGEEKFNAEGTDVVEFLEDGAGDIFSFLGDFLRETCGDSGDAENVVLMDVGDAVNGDIILAAGTDNGEFGLEIDELFQNGFGLADLFPGGLGVFGDWILTWPFRRNPRPRF